MDPAIWWYEWDGRQAGPVPHASLLELVRSGQLAAEARVWRPGMRGWEPLRRVPEVAAALPQPTPLPDAPPTFPPPAGPTAIAPSPTPAPAPPPAAELEPVSWGALVALTLVTFGIYGLVRYYQAARAYEALAGRASRFPTWFWLHVGLGVASVAVGVIGGPLGFITGVASLVFGVMSLLETLTVRGEALRQRGVYPRLTSDATHRSLTIAAAATIWLVFGLILAIVEGILFFQDHDAIARALAAKPAPTPAPGASPHARTCPRCGNALAQPARFCDRCGAPAP
jgi:GYF domain 2/Domain of unknown function (DUF4234)